MHTTRRRFLESVSWAALAGGLLPRSLLAEQTATGFREIREKVGIFWGRGGTIGWLISDDGVVVVDSQFYATAKILLDGIALKTERPVDVLINTHHHPDHTGGNGAFRHAAGRIVAHQNVPAFQKAQATERGTLGDQVYANKTFSKKWSVELGAHTVAAEHLGRAHTGGDAIVHFVEANVVHLGDLIFNRWHPLIDAPRGGSVRGWFGVLEKIHEKFNDETVFIFGHGVKERGRTGTRADVALQRDYFHALLEYTEPAVRKGWSRAKTAALEALPGFESFVSVGERFSLAWCLGVTWDELADRPRR